MTPDGFLSNHAGGTWRHLFGQPLLVSLALKPTSSIRLPGGTVNTDGQATDVVTTGRHDPCVGIRATPIAEAMLALVLIDHALRQRGQNGDVTLATLPIPVARQRNDSPAANAHSHSGAGCSCGIVLGAVDIVGVSAAQLAVQLVWVSVGVGSVIALAAGAGWLLSRRRRASQRSQTH